MIKKIIFAFVILLVILFSGMYIVGNGWFGGPWYSKPVVSESRAANTYLKPEEVDGPVQILFGDLHTHTNFSVDSYLYSSNAQKGGGVITPGDACDFARYCSALDFWSINDHAESLTPEAWDDTVQTVRSCNASAGDPQYPDMVSFLGWEWSNNNKADPGSHFGHKNVIFRTWEEGATPTRPIAASSKNFLTPVRAFVFGIFAMFDGFSAASDFGWYIKRQRTLPLCPEGVDTRELPADCMEVALTPTSLYRKLDEWGFDSLVIPHGLSWGVTNPLTGDFRTQLSRHDMRYQKLLEVYSGHGNSEQFVDFDRIVERDGVQNCPEASEQFTPCCQQAGVMARQRCEDPDSRMCADEVSNAIADFVAMGSPQGRRLFPDATLSDWGGCGQLQRSFQPSSMYVPRLSAQYALALGFDGDGEAQRVKFGLIGASDTHQARPGNSYKEFDRVGQTDTKDLGIAALTPALVRPDGESGSFYYSGGLVAVHAQGRHRDAIWDALSNRQVYATSGDRMLVWFDLLNGPGGEVPMGSEVLMTGTPRFRVRALGALEQRPGCPDYAVAALGQERLEQLCRGECYWPGGDRRKAIARIEIIRIRPQITPEEEITPLIEDNWRVFECSGDGSGCEVEFEDPEYGQSGRPALYYARVIQESEQLISGDPFGCTYDDQGNCIQRNYCVGESATRDNNCLSAAEPRAWTSPIFLEQAK